MAESGVTVHRGSRVVRALLIVAGITSVALGVLGIFLPILPTTPFLLLAAACFSRSSQRFYDWLMTNRWFGSYIRNYREGRGIELRHKVGTLLLLWLVIGATALLVIEKVWVKVLLGAIATGVTIHISRIKTYRPANPAPTSTSRATARPARSTTLAKPTG